MERCAACGEPATGPRSLTEIPSCPSCKASGQRFVGAAWSRTVSEDGIAEALAEEAPDFPERLGRYAIGEPLGRGGMGWVFRARDETLRRDVALKVLPPATSEGRDRRARFEREARALAGFKHPRVLDILDVGEQDGFLYLALELMEGTLATRVLDPATASREEVLRVCAWLTQAAEGVAALHARGTLHRDIKPSNLLLDGQGEVKVGDFGLAHVEGEAELTRTGVGMGSAMYSAPEQLRGQPATPRSDVYALGASLHALLTGESPSPAGGLSRLPSSAPRGLRDLLESALDARPDKRPSDAAAFLQALTAAIDPRRRRRRRALLAVAVVGLALLAWTLPREVVRGPAPQLSSFFTVHSAEALAENHELLARLSSAGLSSPAQPANWPVHERLRLEVGSLELEALSPSDESPRRLRLEQDGRRFGELVLPHPRSDSEGWSLVSTRVDRDLDGFPEVLLFDGRDVAFVHVDPASYRRPELGWRTRVAERFGQGSLAVAEVDGDGEPEVLVADPGRMDGQSEWREPSLVVLDARDGRIERRLVLDSDGTTLSTPIPLHDAAGRVDVVVLDLQAHLTGKRHAELFAWMPAAEEPPRRVTVLEAAGGRLTWTVPVDLDGDGAEDGIVARFGESGRGGALLGFDPRGEGRLFWTRRFEAPQNVTPVLSQQDEDADPELCVVDVTALSCFDLEALASGGAASWRQEAPSRFVPFNRLVRVPDIDGDGAEELAVSEERGVWVFSKAWSEPRLLSPDPESVALPGAPAGFIAAPVVLPLGARSELRLLGRARNGTLVAWELDAQGARRIWSVKGGAVGTTLTATPRLVRHGSEDRWGLLVRHGLALWDLGLSDPAGTAPEPIWSPVLDGLVPERRGAGTPTLVSIGDRDWVVVTESGGHVRGLPMPFPVRLAESDAWDAR